MKNNTLYFLPSDQCNECQITKVLRRAWWSNQTQFNCLVDAQVVGVGGGWGRGGGLARLKELLLQATPKYSFIINFDIV